MTKDKKVRLHFFKKMDRNLDERQIFTAFVRISSSDGKRNCLFEMICMNKNAAFPINRDSTCVLSFAQYICNQLTNPCISN